jgi:FMN reductase
MEFSVRSLRGWAVPYVVPVPQAARVFADSGEVQDDAVDQQLRLLVVLCWFLGRDSR